MLECLTEPLELPGRNGTFIDGEADSTCSTSLVT